MGLFGTILEKLGFGGSAAQAAPAQAPAAPQATAPAPMTAVDVVAKLEGLAAKHKEKTKLESVDRGSP